MSSIPIATGLDSTAKNAAALGISRGSSLKFAATPKPQKLRAATTRLMTPKADQPREKKRIAASTEPPTPMSTFPAPNLYIGLQSHLGRFVLLDNNLENFTHNAVYALLTNQATDVIPKLREETVDWGLWTSRISPSFPATKSSP